MALQGPEFPPVYQAVIAAGEMEKASEEVFSALDEMARLLTARAARPAGS